MSYMLTCYTLYDITQTGVLNRQRPTSLDTDWAHKRNTQSNFDTVLQAISLRSQPDILRNPKKIKISFDKFKNFGFLYEDENEINCWTFDFSVHHSSVFNDGITELGALYSDCQNVPMIKCGTEWSKLSNMLDTTEELRNIYFEVLTNG